MSSTPYIRQLIAREVERRHAELEALTKQCDEQRQLYVNLTARLAEARTQYQIALEAKQESEK